MNAIFLAFGTLTALTYLVFCKFEGSYINALTITTFMKGVVEFFLEPLTYNNNIFAYDIKAFSLIYSMSYIGYLMLILGAIRFRKNILSGQIQKYYVSTIFAWILLLLSILIYLPILLKYSGYILQPRYIYEQTRTGYGLQYFGASLLANLSFVVFLLSKRKHHFFFVVVLLLTTLLRGSKGQILTDISIYCIWFVYLKKIQFGFGRALACVLVLGAFLSGIFVMNYRGQITSLLLTIAGFSDYNRNASLVVESRDFGNYNGVLLYQDFLYSKMPRLLWPEKPKNFGEFHLAEEHFPVLFELNQGAPSFGLGIYFADFGYIAFFVYALFNFLRGRFLSYYLTSFERQKTVVAFVMVLFFSGTSLLPAGSGYFLLEHWVIGFGLVYLAAARTRPAN